MNRKDVMRRRTDEYRSWLNKPICEAATGPFGESRQMKGGRSTLKN